jgi:RNA ligase
MNLVETNEAFYYIDRILNNRIYRVFTYRLASYTDFLLPDALECRGHMFEIDATHGYVRLASLPFEKFFNLNENPMTMDLNLDSVAFVHDKRDGSLISTFLHDDMVCLKSKTAVASDQAIDASSLLRSNTQYHEMVSEYVRSGSTVIFEYTAPDNRIVLPYQEPELKILGARNHIDGSYVEYVELYDYFGEHMTEDCTDRVADPEHFISQIPEMTGIEGFVIGLNGGQRIKLKTNEYLSLHRAMDSINSNKRLFEVALENATDDLRSLFYDDEYTLNRIDEMEQIVGKAYNGLVSSVENYYNENKDLDRKDYAIKAQQELDKLGFVCVMKMYTGCKPPYKEMLMKNFKNYVEDNDE